MIKQKRTQKITALGKRRVNVFKLQQRVVNLEKLMNHQQRINSHNQKLRDLEVITTEEILERLSQLERIVLPERAVRKRGVFRRWLDRFYAWLCR
ncbi:hypothetical protein [Avibacterium paragallinarum]|uniref:Uncharacterized protein n=1 Tax=Avibacterium paragallinarum TaxID=728 RepID=A0AAE5WHJ2_AVIPA|nr:hypothetical protein [Avibacterium paragallinarum]MEE3608158.1 hypothetical protein [Avibacterium paragallinarum]MEE3622168.1 hypothetical protein [Avibacterium paragallinarum]MEE3669287.1 hypothetical protein [Avibacterium paragallinarum]MEE3681413.1 hypothetical protein [Avibacterium paragallinarum]MEE4386723.1 hypothetical protein [Avibacterium paragallinarum]